MSIHSVSPPKTLSVSPSIWEAEHYKILFQTINDSNLDYVIMDRAHLGCYVYGSLFRNYNDNDIKSLDSIEESIPDLNNIWLITVVDEPEGIKSRDDGKSLETDLADYRKTKTLFESSYYLSKIPNKRLIDLSELKDTWMLRMHVTEFLQDTGFFRK